MKGLRKADLERTCPISLPQGQGRHWITNKRRRVEEEEGSQVPEADGLVTTGLSQRGGGIRATLDCPVAAHRTHASHHVVPARTQISAVGRLAPSG